MRLILGGTEIDFLTVSNSDILLNKGVEIPLQDLLEVAQNHAPNCGLFTMVDVDITNPDNRLAHDFEITDEQNSFARDLLDKIMDIIKHYPNTGGAKNLKADILTAIDDSMFER